MCQLAKEKQYHHQQFQESEESPTIQYCIMLQETQRQQRQRIIQKVRMSITNRFITKLSILLLTPSKIVLTNQHLSCLHFKGDYDTASLT